MRKLNKLLFIAIFSIVIATPIIRYKLKAQSYVDSLSSGVILEATQRLKGSTLENTKILLVDYLPMGSTGVVLSTPMEDDDGKLAQGERKHSGRKDVLYWGGPVAQSHFFWLAYQPETGSINLVGNKSALTEDVNPTIVTRFTGYTGWGENQLQMEVRRGDWRVFQADRHQISLWLLANNLTNNSKPGSEQNIE